MRVKMRSMGPTSQLRAGTKLPHQARMAMSAAWRM